MKTLAVLFGNESLSENMAPGIPDVTVLNVTVWPALMVEAERDWIAMSGAIPTVICTDAV